MNREAERKRLVELLDEANSKGNIIGTGDTADYLLENGVNVPPFKVGQTVYSIINCKNRAEKLVITSVHHYEKYSSFCALSRSQKKYYFEYEDIGKTVFTSREEAEKMLKGEEK